MKNEFINNNEVPSPEDFWPEAKDLLDKHYAAKKKRILFFFASIAVIMIAFVQFFPEQKLFDITPEKVTNAHKYEAKTTPQNLSHPNDLSINTSDDTPETATEINYATKLIPNHQKLENTPVIANHSIEKENYGVSITAINNSIAETSTVENLPIANAEDRSEILSKVNPVGLVERPDFISFLPVPMIRYKSISADTIFNIRENNNKEVSWLDDYYKHKKPWHLAIEIYSGMQVNSKRITTNQLLTEYADIRNTAEKKINTNYIGFNISVERKGFVIQSGLSYQTIGENNQYKAQSKQWLKNDETTWEYYNRQIIKIDTVYHFGIVSYNQTIINAKDSTLLTKYDSVYVYHTDSNMIKANGKTKITYLELPILLGYQISMGKFSITPMAGVSMGYLLQSTGMYLNKSITSVETINESKLLNSYSLNYLLKLQVSYHLKSHWLVSLLPQYKSNIISVSPPSSGVNTKYRSLGASIGLTYKL
jgi:hypothetical protein